MVKYKGQSTQTISGHISWNDAGNNLHKIIIARVCYTCITQNFSLLLNRC